MFAVVDSRKKRKGGEVKGASGGKKVKKEETEEEKQLKVSTVKVKPSFFYILPTNPLVKPEWF